jgi:nucleotide-binding universal stress UspA family protein
LSSTTYGTAIRPPFCSRPDRRASLIVIGTCGTNSRSPFLLGTVSQDVAVRATCPVLLIPTP